jgi:hypothetical protein
VRASLVLVALILFASACGDNVPPGGGGDSCDGGGCAENDGGPTPGSRILWQATADEIDDLPAGACFGRALARGDLDGDGDGDLVVGAPRCLGDGGSAPDALVVFPGEGDAFAAPIVVLLTWEVDVEFSFGQMTLDVADADGDGLADVVVATRFGASFFRGGSDIAAALAEPAFRIPGTQHRTWAFADVDADGLGDLVGQRGPAAALYLADGDTFTEAALPDGALALAPAGDLDDDGASELWVTTEEGTDLHAGCAEAPCGEPLSGDPLLSLDGSPIATGRAGDHPVVLAFKDGMLQAHDLAPTGSGYTADLVWQSAGDPLFPAFGRGATALADLADPGADASALAVTAAGRVYLFSALPSALDEPLAPAWAYPTPDVTGPDFPGYRTYRTASAGDLSGDGIADLLVAGQRATNDLTFSVTSSGPGVVLLVSGAPADGELPPASIAAPATCDVDSEGDGPADLTIDADVLRRSLAITRESFADDSCAVAEGCVAAPGERRLLRFSTAIRNIGAGPAAVPSPDENPELFEFDECHGHDHLIDFASYELVSASDDVTRGRKQGFFLVDLQRYCADGAPPTFPTFEGENIGLGISVGWADIYTSDLDCQWIDITSLPDGPYTLRFTVNPTGVISEDGPAPNTVTLPVTLRGDTITPR